MAKKTGSKAKPVAQSKRAGLVFPVGRIGSALKKGRYGKRVSPGAAVFLAAVLEYATNELLQLSLKAAETGKDAYHNIKPRHLTLAVREDDELSSLLSNVTIAGGGVVGGVHGALQKKKKKAAAAGEKKPKKAKKAKKSKKASGSKKASE